MTEWSAAQWAPLVKREVPAQGLDAGLVLAIIEQESGGNPYAIRVERGFWRRYGAAVLRNVKATASTTDDRWAGYPDLAACSYGLMQVLWVTAVELGIAPTYPTELCDPELNVRAGCRKLALCMRQSGNDVRAALLRYNGGSRAEYATEVLRRVPMMNRALIRAPIAAWAK